jgi:hypothetical protein
MELEDGSGRWKNVGHVDSNTLDRMVPEYCVSRWKNNQPKRWKNIGLKTIRNLDQSRRILDWRSATIGGQQLFNKILAED